MGLRSLSCCCLISPALSQGVRSTGFLYHGGNGQV